MKIQPVQNIQQPKNTICTKVRNVLTKYKLKLKTLAYDIFERHGYYKDKGGKWKSERYISPLTTSPGDAKDLIFGKVMRFYPEDLEKMKNMSFEEELEFRRNLVRNKKYYEVDMYRPLEDSDLK